MLAEELFGLLLVRRANPVITEFEKVILPRLAVVLVVVGKCCAVRDQMEVLRFTRDSAAGLNFDHAVLALQELEPPLQVALILGRGNNVILRLKREAGR